MKVDDSIDRIKITAYSFLVWGLVSLLLRLFQGVAENISSFSLSISFLEMFLVIVSSVALILKRYVFILLLIIVFLIDNIEYFYFSKINIIALLVRGTLFLFLLGAFFSYLFLLRNPSTNSDQTNSKGNESNSDETKTKDVNYYHNVFGLKYPSNIQQIHDEYKKAIKKYHPDRLENFGEEFREMAEIKTKEINEAYQFLINIYK